MLFRSEDYAALPVALVIEGAACDRVDAAGPTIMYNLASYLLIKNAHTYQTLLYRDVAAFEDFSPDFYLRHGAPVEQMRRSPEGVYHRRFTHALALLNPSGSRVATYDLGDAMHRNSQGQQFTGAVAIPPVTGMILLSGAPGETSPLREP